MPHIAKVFDDGGGFAIVELRQGTLNDIPASQLSEWRTVIEQTPVMDVDTQALGETTLTITPTGTSVSMVRAVHTHNFHWNAMRLINYTKSTRLKVERGGLTLPNGVKIDTDLANQYEISILKRRGDDGQLTFPYRYRVRGSDYVNLSLAQITAADNAIANHLKEAIIIEESTITAILAGTITTQVQVDAAAWPG